MNGRRFLETWRRSLEFRIQRSEWLVELGRRDEHFAELRDEIEAFKDAVQSVQTQTDEWLDEENVVFLQPHRQSA